MGELAEFDPFAPTGPGRVRPLVAKVEVGDADLLSSSPQTLSTEPETSVSAGGLSRNVVADGAVDGVKSERHITPTKDCSAPDTEDRDGPMIGGGHSNDAKRGSASGLGEGSLSSALGVGSDHEASNRPVGSVSSHIETDLAIISEHNSGNASHGAEELAKVQKGLQSTVLSPPEAIDPSPFGSLDPSELASNVSTPSKRRASNGGAVSKPDSEEDRPFDFAKFLNLMRNKSAYPIARYVKSFLTEFSKKNWTAREQVTLISDFRLFIRGMMRKTPPFSDLDDTEWNNSQEGMEKLLMNRLYGRAFSPKIPHAYRRDDQEEDVLRDRVLAEKLRLWSWIDGQHLDIGGAAGENSTLQAESSELDLESDPFAKLACTELNKINNYRAPRDKLICILNCSKVIWALIRKAKLEQNADAFLPLLIYVILKAQTPYLISNINYINRFRSQEHRQGEAAYYLAMASSAVAFIEALERASLNISDEEYQSKIEAAVVAEQQRAKSGNDPDEPDGAAAVASPEPLMAASVLSTSAGLLVEQFKSYANKIFEPDDVATPPGRGSPGAEESPRPAGGLTPSPEEAAARQASAEMYRAEQIQQREFTHIADMLREMFPSLDGDIIEDVLRQKGTRLGAAIDVCMLLMEGS